HLTKSDLQALQLLQTAVRKEGPMTTLDKTIEASIILAKDSSISMDSAQFHLKLVKWSMADDVDDLTNKVLGILSNTPIKNAEVALEVSEKIIKFLSENSSMICGYDLPALENLQALVHMFAIQTKQNLNRLEQQSLSIMEKTVEAAVKKSFHSKSLTEIPPDLGALVTDCLSITEAINLFLNNENTSSIGLAKAIKSASTDDVYQFYKDVLIKFKESPYLFNKMINVFFKNASTESQKIFFCQLNHNVNIEDFLSSVIQALPKTMKEIDLQYCYEYVTTGHIKKIISHFDELESLNLSGCKMNSDNFAELANSPKMNHLTSLILDKTYRGDDEKGFEGFIELVQSPKMFRLQNLSLAYCNLRDNFVIELAHSPYMCNLVSLNLNKCKITSKAAEAIAESVHMSGLKKLDISSNFIGDKGITSLAKSYNMAQLENLNLSNCGLLDSGVIELAKSNYITKLKSLILGSRGSWNKSKIGITTVSALANSPNMSKLEQLNLSNGEFGDSAISAIANSNYLNLKSLNLSGNKNLTDLTLITIAKSPSFHELQELDIQWCLSVSEEGIMALAKSDCTPKLHDLDWEGINISDAKSVNNLLEARKSNLQSQSLKMDD
nr:hypothetical protein [Parachlamydiaceae bacterium]